MTATESLTTSEPLLGHPSAELAFRIHGGKEHGRIVRFTGQRCVVGSAADCALRFEAPGVRPRHCLILRGAARTIVRRLSTDTRLNGHDFDDSLLAAGDRIAIGPFELEVLEHATRRGTSREATFHADPALRDQSEQARASADTDRNRLHAELTAQCQALEHERAAWQTRQQEIEARWAVREQSLRDESEQARSTADADRNRLQAELAAQCQALEHERAAWQARQQELESQWATREQALRDESEQSRSTAQIDRERLQADRERLQAELTSQCQALEHERTAWQARQQELESQWATREQALRDENEQARDSAEADRNRLHAELTAQCEALEHERAAWQARQQELESQWAAREQSLRDESEQARASANADRNRLQAELVTQCQALEHERAAWQTRQQELESQWTAREQSLRDESEQARASADAHRNRLQAELTAQCQALEHERTAWQARQQELEVQWAARERSLRDESERARAFADVDRKRLHAELSTQCEALEHERAAWRTRQREIEAQSAAREQTLRDESEQARAAAEADRNRLHTELEQERTQWRIQRQELETRAVTRQQDVHGGMSDDVARLQAELADQREALEQERTARQAERLEWESQWAGRERAGRLVTEKLRREMSDDVAIPQAESTDQREGRCEAPPRDENGEGSIDDYMSMLMERLRRESRVARAQPAPAPVRESQPPLEPPLEPPPGDEPRDEVVATERAQPAEVKPRATPAERTVDFSAMRELANLNARAAIDTHVRRQLEQRGIGKVATALAASMGAGVLLWLHWLGHATAFHYAMVCLAVSAIWVLQYAAAHRPTRLGGDMTKRIDDSLASHGNSGDVDGETTSRSIA